MQWYTSVFELIDMGSFSNLWYWIALAVVWSTASHWVLGVPYDLVERARRKGGQAEDDVHMLVRVYVNRLLHIGHVSGMWLTAIVTAALTALAVLGFHYGVEFCQAVFLLLFPMSLVGVLSVRAAGRIAAADVSGPALYRRLRHHRMKVQAIGMISILVTAMWGMWQNMHASVLGG